MGRAWCQRGECKYTWLNSNRTQKEAKDEYESRIQALEAKVQSLVNDLRESRSQTMDSILRRRAAEGLLTFHPSKWSEAYEELVELKRQINLLEEAYDEMRKWCTYVEDNLTLRPPYQTWARQKKTMEQIGQNQVASMEYMDSVKGNVEGIKDKIDQLTHAITNMMEREVGANKRKVASTSTPPPVDGYPLQVFISDIQGDGASGPIQIPIPQDNYVGLRQQYEDEDHRGMVQEIKPATRLSAILRETRTDDKYKILEERLKVVEGFNILEVEKYKGVSFPKNHLRMCLLPYFKPQAQQPREPPPQNQQQNGYPRRDQQRPRKDFDLIPMMHTRILPYLLQRGLVETRPLAPLPIPPPHGARCDSHVGSPGHTTEKCLALKFKVLGLLDRKVISFTSENLKDPLLLEYL
ncbi:hypothetical protein KIW84_033784 [Lathyrus oleraceus]|uniref:Uncharacterized protein n=1 Tax=Pisum sativum TaxID=3888 RepID=A0A9D4XYK1_PEA|nr:hypothetical protein KIW84_033784 [Pisum sativum]